MMIQELNGHKFDNAYKRVKADKNSILMCFVDGKILARYDEEEKRLIYPMCGQEDLIYLFSVDETKYFLKIGMENKDGFGLYSMRDLMNLKLKENLDIFVAYSAYHLYVWYSTSVYCGRCGKPMVHDETERAMVCTHCDNHVYPRINPAVIIGVKNGDKLLLTKYKSGFAHNALVAGFTELGETFEETVQREVKEETGLKVKNIRYYKSQPWGIAQDILAGYYCEVDGDDRIHMDDHELKYAEWVKREDIILQPKRYSLTNEMMERFKQGKE